MTSGSPPATTPTPCYRGGGHGLGITGIGDWLGHDGAIFGYSNAVFFDPKEKATVVVMVNKASTTLVAALPVFFAVATPLYPRSFPH
jgi:D-alanyl-D-alanine carboxypeptidase